MKLNPDCIRDILLYIESRTDSEIDCIEFEELLENLTNYDKNTIHYHVNQISNLYLVHNVEYSDDMPNIISDLSPSGHEFLANIRSNTTWNKTKSIAKDVGSISLDSLKQISIGVVSELIKNQFI